MPSSLTNVMQTGDVSTSAADFAAPGTANPGSTGKLADAGHVHPGSGAWSLGYEIVSQTFTLNTAGYTGYVYPQLGLFVASVAAPTGKKVVGGGFKLGSGTDGSGHKWQVAIASYIAGSGSSGGNPNSSAELYQNGPASDGSAWNFEASLHLTSNSELVTLSPVVDLTSGGSPTSTDTLLTVYAISIAV